VIKSFLESGCVGDLTQLFQVGLVDDWLSSYDPGSRRTLRSIVRGFLGYAGVPLADLIERQKFARGDDAYEVLKVVESFVAQLQGRRSYKRTVYSVLGQLFAYHHAPLPRDPRFQRSFHMQGVQPPTSAKLTIDDVKQIIMAAKPRDRCMILVKWHGLMGVRELEYVNLHGWPQIKQQLDAGADIIHLDLPPRKRSEYPFYTLIGGDAIKYGLKPYLEKYGEPPSKNGPIWLTEKGIPVSRKCMQNIWRSLTNRLELTPRKHNNRGTRYGYHSHETRDLASSVWTVSGANEKVCEFLMGHLKQIDSNLYKKFWKTHPQFVVDEYRKALPYLNLISGETGSKNQQDEIRTLKEKVAIMERAFAKLNLLNGEVEQVRRRLDS